MFEKSATFASKHSRNSALSNGDKSCWLKCILLATFLVSLGSSIAAQVTEKKLETNSAGSIPTASIFEANLLHAKLLADPKSNLVVSPLNLKAAMALLGEGAQGETKQAIAKTLGIGNTPTAFVDMGKSYRDLQSDVQIGSPLLTATGLFVNKDWQVKPQYQESLKSSFGAEVNSIDVSAPNALGVINQWFAQKTQGKVGVLLGNLPKETKVILGSTLYFKSNWAVPFDKSKTVAAPFNGTAGEQKVPTMKANQSMQYAETDTYQMLQIPFEQKRFALALYLPKADQSVGSLLELSTKQGLGGVFEAVRLKNVIVDLSLPKFELSSKADYKNLLSELGMAKAMGTDADFGGMSAKPLVVDQVNHQASFAIDEAGGEVTAATAVVTTSRSAHADQKVIFNVNRPFLASLIDQSTGTHLAWVIVNHF